MDPISLLNSADNFAIQSINPNTRNRLHEVTDLRNDVAHANLLVENTDSNVFLSSGRTTENLYDTLETIDQVLTNLQEAGYAPETVEAQRTV